METKQKKITKKEETYGQGWTEGNEVALENTDAN